MQIGELIACLVEARIKIERAGKFSVGGAELAPPNKRIRQLQTSFRGSRICLNRVAKLDESLVEFRLLEIFLALLEVSLTLDLRASAKLVIREYPTPQNRDKKTQKYKTFHRKPPK